MRGDFTRFTHDPRKAYSRVLQQQGRVTLDADSNEQADIVESLRRALARDLVGAAGAPAAEAGFGVVVAPDGEDLLLSPGRYWVDGLLVQCGGRPSRVLAVDGARVALAQPLEGARAGAWVELAAGARRHVARVDRVDGAAVALASAPPRATWRSARVVASLRTQPVAPRDVLPSGKLVAYLEAWEREVTAVEDPDLADVALGGAETSVRVAVAWRVALGEEAPRAVAAWERDAALTVSTEEGGYRGVENRLYRVEVHDSGPAGKATFKWSRDNAALSAPVVAVDDADGRRARLGRGAERFRAGDLVEVSSAAAEAEGRAGALRRVATVDFASGLVTLDADAGDRLREPLARLTRWDGAGAARAGSVALEDGIVVAFAGGDFRAGDWWSFAARTATRDVERPEAEPPRAAPRAVAPLARIAWTKGRPRVTSDLRRVFAGAADPPPPRAGVRVVFGRIMDERGRPRPGLRVRAFDRDVRKDDLLGEAVTDARGHFSITYEKRAYRESGENEPEVYVEVTPPRGRKPLLSTRDEPRKPAGAAEEFELVVPREA